MTQFQNGGRFGRRLSGDFRYAERVSHALIQDENAETFEFRPMLVKPNWPTVPDPDRPISVVRGTFSWESALQRVGMRETEVVTRKPKIDFDRTDLVTQPRRGDVFTRLCDGSTFEVASLEKDGFTGWCVHLIQLGVPH